MSIDYREQKIKFEELKTDWKNLWHERVDDKSRAEGIAIKDYSALFVDRGTVIIATRSFKMLSFDDILRQHQITELYRFVQPSPEVGGWRKFIRTSVATKKPVTRTKRATQYSPERKKRQQLKKGGKGWLHR